MMAVMEEVNECILVGLRGEIINESGSADFAKRI